MTNNEARKYFDDKGLDYSVLTKSNIEKLKEIVKEELKNFKNAHNLGFRMFLRMVRKQDIKTINGKNTLFLRCRGTLSDGKKSFNHFTDREAISFNRDEFIGFAGWADSTNVQPFLSAFVKWCDLMEAGK
jgi:hypothetical protein